MTNPLPTKTHINLVAFDFTLPNSPLSFLKSKSNQIKSNSIYSFTWFTSSDQSIIY